MPGGAPTAGLIAGPYAAPRCRVGRGLYCLVRGDVAVRGMTDAPVPWPYTTVRGGTPSLIVCGDLARAVAVESAAAVARHWGVGRKVVSGWRRALGVGRMTEGTRRRWSELAEAKLGGHRGDGGKTSTARRTAEQWSAVGRARRARRGAGRGGGGRAGCGRLTRRGAGVSGQDTGGRGGTRR
jgi:hypothetical protein